MSGLVTDADVLPARRMGRLRRLALRFSGGGPSGRSTCGVAFERSLVPMLVVFLLAGIVLGVVQVVEYVAPFVYTMF